MRTFVGAALAAFLAIPASAGVRGIWAVNDGERVERDDLAHPARRSNSAWDGERVRLFAARNEIVAFQVIVEADEEGIGEASIALPELRKGTHRIVHWVWEPGGTAVPGDTLGWKPVVLVPENARAGRGGFPVRVPASRNQGFWVDVYTGRGRPAGVYDGTLTVIADGRSHEVPVELELLDVTLPDVNSLRAMVYYEPSQPELYQGRNLDPVYHRFAHRQRIELVHDYDVAQVQAQLGRFDGGHFTRERGYDGPGQGKGNSIVPATFYGAGPAYETRERAWKASDAWMTFVEENLPEALTFLYLLDEPRPAAYPRLRAIAENVRSNPGPGRRLPLFVTKTVVPELDEVIDIWCAPPQLFDIPRAEAERKKGRRVWFYNGGRPQGPALVIDAPATEARTVAWAAFKHDVEVYFYWHGVHWRHNRQKSGDRNQNVWVDPISFDNRGDPTKQDPEDQGYINGDGVLLYPGEDVLHPDQDRGIAGPCSSIRLANLRRGLQDHLYLTMARERGLERQVREVLQAIVPRVFSDAGETVTFAEAGDAYEAARLRLGRALAGTQGPQ